MVPGARNKFVALWSNLRSKCTVLKKILAALLGSFGAWGIVPPLVRLWDRSCLRHRQSCLRQLLWFIVFSYFKLGVGDFFGGAIQKSLWATGLILPLIPLSLGGPFRQTHTTWQRPSDATPASASTAQIRVGDERRTNDTDLCVSRRATFAVKAACDGARVLFQTNTLAPLAADRQCTRQGNPRQHRKTR